MTQSSAGSTIIGTFALFVVLCAMGCMVFLSIQEPEPEPLWDCSQQTTEHAKVIQKITDKCYTPYCLGKATKIGCKQYRPDPAKATQ